jgi:DNA-binding IclR family transcriptional regulator
MRSHARAPDRRKDRNNDPASVGTREPPLSSLADALRVVLEFCRTDQDEITVSTLSRRTGMPKSKISRVLATFRDAGWLEQNPRSRAYRVGLKAYAFGGRFLHGSALAREAASVLRMVADRSGYASHLCVLDGTDPLYLMGMEGPVSVDFGSHVGSYFPVHATAPGRILLAFSDPSTIDKVLKEPRMRSMPTRRGWNIREIRRDIAAIREVGYAVSRGDRRPGVGGIAVPIFGPEQNILGSLSISFPQAMVPATKDSYYAELLFEAANILSRRLGASPYPYLLRQQLDDGKQTATSARRVAANP